MAFIKLIPAAVFFVFSTTSYAGTLPEKAIIDIKTIKEAITIEKTLNTQSEAVAPEHTSWFEVMEGDGKIIITAPHATKPFREGKYRFSDGGGSGALAEMLNKLTGATVIVTTYPSPSDPNYYDDNTFKAEIKKQIARHKPLLLLDIHGSHGFRPYDVDFGTMDGKSLLGDEKALVRLMDYLKNEGVANFSYNYFAAAKNQTITKFASNLDVPTIQMEISSTWLTPSANDISAHRFAQLLQAMTMFIKAEQGR